MAIFEVDPGHGAHDPGALGSRSKEKDNVLKVAKRLKTLLEGYGHTVRLTRSTDVFLSLSERANKANRNGADYFISLHNNAFASKSATGFETFIYNGGVSQKTRDFQNAVHGAIAKKINIVDRGKKTANFAVLRQSKMPALLIEYAFITNNEDEKILIDKVNNLAQWTCDGIIDAVGGTKKKGNTSSKTTSKPKAKAPSKSKPTQSSANLTVDGKWGKSTTRALQRALGTPVDGVISKQPRNSVSQSLYGDTVSFGSGGSNVIVALQRKVGASADGKLGPATIRSLQRHLGTVQDGVLSRPSLVVKELQRRLNAGTF